MSEKRLLTVKIIASLLLAAVLAFGLTRPSQAQDNTQRHFSMLYSTMQIDRVMEILSDEGRAMVDELAADGQGIARADWQLLVERVYDPKVMKRDFRDALSGALTQANADVEAMHDFFDGNLGRRITDLELDARVAFANEMTEEMAAEAWAQLDPDDPRAILIEDYVVANDLIEMNVAGSMGADYAYQRAFFDAMSDGAAAGATSHTDMGSLTDKDILREIWGRVDDTRAETSEWIYAYSTLAYEPLSLQDLEAYVSFSKSNAGRALNLALFAAFDDVYSDISRRFGNGTAVLMLSNQGQEL